MEFEVENFRRCYSKCSAFQSYSMEIDILLSWFFEPLAYIRWVMRHFPFNFSFVGFSKLLLMLTTTTGISYEYKPVISFHKNLYLNRDTKMTYIFQFPLVERLSPFYNLWKTRRRSQVFQNCGSRIEISIRLARPRDLPRNMHNLVINGREFVKPFFPFPRFTQVSNYIQNEGKSDNAVSALGCGRGQADFGYQLTSTSDKWTHSSLSCLTQGPFLSVSDTRKMFNITKLFTRCVS